MDSAYMGRPLALVARKAWLINAVGMAQINHCGSDVDLVKVEHKLTKVGSLGAFS